MLLEILNFPSKYKAIVLCCAIQFHVSESLKISFKMQGYSLIFSQTRRVSGSFECSFKVQSNSRMRCIKFNVLQKLQLFSERKAIALFFAAKLKLF